MGEFFKGWRRTVGVLTLLMALVFMAGWVRSLYVLDEFAFIETSSYIRIDSMCGGIVRVEIQPKPKRGMNRQRWGWAYLDRSEARYPDVFGWELEAVIDNETDKVSVWQIAGFAFSEQTLNGEHLNIVILPYWSVTIPLTLISLGLLLPKPRKTKQKNDGPIPTQGT